ncbi:putative WEB family protein [Rosa chinensis]|uniref:Putative WEB family protein n=1 Tax=Rosa chinensis TaxID=74649 RepID=A0A2P6QLR8_ROSCH|nr:putative WEB family protein [Rosa chinensis]
MNAETTKAQALVELAKAKVTHEELNKKLASLGEFKESAIKASEAAKNRAKQLEEANNGNLAGTDGAWKQDLETDRAQYMNVITELDAAKQELRKIRQDCDASLEAKVTAFKQAAEAKDAAKANAERVNELSKEIAAVHESIGQVNLASEEAQQEKAKVFSEKDVLRQAYKATAEESAKKLLSLQIQFDP